jgi:hypothetical protein
MLIAARAVGRYLLSLLVAGMVPLMTAAQAKPGPTTIRRDLHHDVSLPLAEMVRKAPAASPHEREAEPVRAIPLPRGLQSLTEDPVRQSRTAGYTPLLSSSFEGLGNGRYGFTVQYAPPDTNGAVGATQYVQWVNADFAVFNKSNGALVAGPVAGNVLWSGFGGGCELNNDGDPVVLYDKIASRWVMSQFSVSTTPYLQCVAVSSGPDATGTWYRYAFQYSDFDDYPKMGVWPDAYYETFNMFLNGQTFVGADVCAFDRNKMLSGQAATQICFQQGVSVGGLLPADLDGATLPPPGSPNYVVNFGSNALDLYKFHVDFANPANSTFAGPTVIPVAAFTPLCGGGSGCVPQPGTTTKLDSLADRLMYRLAYRNFGSYESLVVNQSVAVAGSGGVRWYEIQAPNGTPVVAQQGTYAPDSDYRWMGSVAMDKAGDLALGYSLSSSSTYPSIAVAGRLPTDPPGALETATTVIAGSGSQTPGLSRWGDCSSMTVDPTDDCTFWYTNEYLVSNGVWNWNTRIASFQFPECSAQNYVALYPTSLSFGVQAVGTTSSAQPITLTNHQPVSLTIGSIVASSDYTQTNNCGTSLAANASCTINVSFQPLGTGVRGGTLTVTDNAADSPQVATLTGLGTQPPNCIPNILSDGGFESGTLTCWQSGGAFLPVISTQQAHGGSFAAQLGATGTPEPNGDSWLYQTVAIPTNADSPTLSFWYWPWTADVVTYDWQEAQIRDTHGNMLAQIFKLASNTQTWTKVTYDLTPYKGQTIQIYFNAHEDGAGDLTYMYLDDVSITTGGASQALQFVPVAPCRLVDTRPDRGGSGPIPGGSYQNFPIPQEGNRNIPATAAAYSLNVSVVPQGPLGYLTIWPAGQSKPVVATLNSLDGRIKANAAIVPAGAQGAISIFATNTTNVILDINGYFAPPSVSTLAFYPLAPCRVADTRMPTFPPGLGPPYLPGLQQRDFPLLSATACNIPSTAAAYSLNFSVVPHGPLGYMTVWPTGQPRPTVSTLNDIPGTIIANAAIVPAGSGGQVSVYPSNDTDVIVDINGYFAPPGAGGLSLYPAVPCRVLDTRQVGSGQPFSGALTPPVNVAGSPCLPPLTAQAYVFNATVVPQGPLGYLTLWPDGAGQPGVSTLNALDGSITNNMAIVPTNNGVVDAYASGITQLILDIASYFAP